MSVVIAFLIIGILCTIITVRTLVVYNNFSFIAKLLLSVIIGLGWFAPCIMWWIKYTDSLSGNIYTYVTETAYVLFGFNVILFLMLLMRDFVWYLIYGIAKLFKISAWRINPRNISVLSYANVIVLLFAILTSSYAIYEGTKVPEVKYVEFSSSKLSRDIKIVQLSDWDISRTTSLEHLREVVAKTNSLNPDIILLTGSIIDDRVKYINEYLDILKELRAPYGIYFSFGSDEADNDLYRIAKRISSLGIKILFNNGISIPELNLFLSGIPDLKTASKSKYLAINFEKAIKTSNPHQYRILLSHNPELVSYITPITFDLQISGHTKGGQIFPFHFVISQAHQYLSGTYEVNDVDLYVSRGIGHWGPPMRLLAPAEITCITIKALPEGNLDISDGILPFMSSNNPVGQKVMNA